MRTRTLVLALSLAPSLALPGAVRAQQSTLKRMGDALNAAAAARQAKKISSRYDVTFRKYTKRYFGPAFDWKYFKAQGFAESGLDPNAKSWVGARGVMQLMPSTYHDIASHRRDFGSIDQPEWNIAAGIMHDRYLWELWADKIPDDERHQFMFASYNAGEGTITRAAAVARAKLGQTDWPNVERIAPSVRRWRYLETLGYVHRIDSTYVRLSGAP
ncbi:MAG TPA: transglycosylase SLT domain-containing protein [Gemmatimonadaceae bacterium]|nr:transglycosylase SLT domain-containing protein [Gemmatimonadaceae bacterium]